MIANPLFETELRRLVDERISDVSEQIIAGVMAEPDYRRNTGIIAGLRMVGELCDEANLNIEKR